MRPKIKNYEPGDPAKYAHIKYDGYFCRVIRRAEIAGGWPKLYSKTDKPLELGQLSKPMCEMPFGVNVLGELLAPGRKASYISTAIKNREKLEFVVFAVEGIDTLEDTSLWCIANGFNFAQYYGPKETKTSHWLGELTSLPETVVVGEGYVFKDSAWSNWRRWKPTKTIDLIVHGVTEGDGKYLGLVGALVCKTFEGDIVANVSGFTDAERVDLSTADIGRIVEVKYQYVGDQGRLRHPVFVGFRDDKRPEECSRSQDYDIVLNRRK